MKRLLLLALIFGALIAVEKFSPLCAQQSLPQTAPVPASNMSSNTSASVATNAPSVQSGSEDILRAGFQNLTDRVLKLELETAKPQKSDTGKDILVAVIAGFTGLIAALIGGVMTIVGQRMTAERERKKEINAAKQGLELARETAKQQLDLAKHECILRNTEKVFEFKVKQLELFYAPMFARLEQSKELYKKLHRQLERDDPKRYKVLSQADEAGYWFHIIDEQGKEYGFRLLDQLPAIRQYPNSYALVKAILDIGKQMSEIISQHSGLASADLVKMLGEYTAHYAILSSIDAGGSTIPYPPEWHKMGYYPRPLNEKVETGYRELIRFLDNYSKAGMDLLATLKKTEDALLAEHGQQSDTGGANGGNPGADAAPKMGATITPLGIAESIKK